ncbi:hypothetical protein GMI69_01255 [Eggerthellaceae bacterium zg-887]|uniref:hypothetical protein n=1 Tax=Xiamenia xianingshaonis TaxID=2682776 RepID=UPI0014077ED8|nr:hypothetical protein [Xiamenia xianingshaonis]NHM15303.1 hypothetical protein [Xiamenia xianingshaonis]
MVSMIAETVFAFEARNAQRASLRFVGFQARASLRRAAARVSVFPNARCPSVCSFRSRICSFWLVGKRLKKTDDAYRGHAERFLHHFVFQEAAAGRKTDDFPLNAWKNPQSEALRPLHIRSRATFGAFFAVGVLQRFKYFFGQRNWAIQVTAHLLRSTNS